MDRHLRRLLPRVLVLLAAGTPSWAAAAQAAPAGTYTPLLSFTWGADFNGDSAYEASRDTVVRSLAAGAAAATSGRGFFNYSSGEGPNKINGAAMCYADSEWGDCQQCLDTALSYVFTECTYSSNAAIMYTHCVLRYSTEEFFTEETDWGHVSTVFSTSIVGDVGSWNETRWTMMTRLVAVAAAASPPLATGNTTYKDGTSMVYGLVQCRNDMAPAACISCLKGQLQYLLGNFPSGVFNSYVSVRGTSCFIRQDVNPIVLMEPSGDLSPSSPPPANPSSSKSHKMALIIGLAAAAIVILFLFILSIAWFIYYRTHKRITAMGANQESNEMEGELFKSIGKVAGPTQFAYHVLAAATANFSDDQKLGEGGFGSVYRGFLEELNLCVAIKRVSSSSRQRRKEYASEVKIISRLRHRNLVKLIGWCHSLDELLLVYELMTNTSLDVHLYDTENVLPWRRRYEIIIGIGSALLYLHQDCEQAVLHRDIKPSNVMLDASFTAKLGDFGLARLVDHGGRGAHTTELVGTMGYMDPSCISTGRFSTQSDVYSFGVLLLEVACGRHPVVVHQGKTFHLAQRVLELYGRGEVLDAADRRLNGDFDEWQMECVLVVGLWCTQRDPALRPSIRQAVSVLRFEASLPTTIAATTEGPPVGRVGSAPSTLVLDEEDRVTGRMNLRSTY